MGSEKFFFFASLYFCFFFFFFCWVGSNRYVPAWQTASAYHHHHHHYHSPLTNGDVYFLCSHVFLFRRFHLHHTPSPASQRSAAIDNPLPSLSFVAGPKPSLRPPPPRLSTLQLHAIAAASIPSYPSPSPLSPLSNAEPLQLHRVFIPPTLSPLHGPGGRQLLLCSIWLHHRCIHLHPLSRSPRP
jgi:hypothetical protein